jgi:hypothetical protein
MRLLKKIAKSEAQHIFVKINATLVPWKEGFEKFGLLL